MNWKTILAAAVGLATLGTYFLPTMEACTWVSRQPIAHPQPPEPEYSITGLTRKEQDRLMELQLMDLMQREEDELLFWDI